MTTLPAVVTITDLTLATTLSSAALFEAVQTTNGIIESVSVSLSKIASAIVTATLPTGGSTGQLLGKSGAADFSTAWVNPSSFISTNATSGIMIAGSTSLVVAIATGPFQTTSIGQFGVVIGAGTSLLTTAAPSTAGNLLIDQGAAANPAFRVVGGDFTMSSAGTATIGTNVVSYAKLQQGTGLAVLGFATTAASNVTTFVASAANQTLQIATTGTSIAWGLPAQVLLNTISMNNIATAADTTSFSASYRSFLVMFENVCPANATAILQLQVATTGTAFLSSGYVSNVPTITSQANTVAVDTSTAVILLSGTRATTNVGNGTSYGVNGFIRILNPAAATFKKMVVGELSYINGTAVSTGMVTVTPSGFNDINNALTGFQLSFTPGNIQTGTLKVYGLT